MAEEAPEPLRQQVQMGTDSGQLEAGASLCCLGVGPSGLNRCLGSSLNSSSLVCPSCVRLAEGVGIVHVLTAQFRVVGIWNSGKRQGRTAL